MDESQENGIEAVPEDADGASDATRTLKRLKEALSACEAERKSYLDGWQRAKADLINYRNDDAKRSHESIEYMRREIFSGLIPILDSFHLALRSGIPKAAEQGVVLIHSQLEDALKRLGLKEIPVQVGDPFNPEIHESMGEARSRFPNGSVAEVLQKGFIIGSYVLRPARVKIAGSEQEHASLAP